MLNHRLLKWTADLDCRLHTQGYFSLPKKLNKALYIFNKH